VLAFYLQLLYWRRHRYYGEHLVVAFHAQTAAFIVASFVALAPDGPFGESVALLACVTIVAHGAIALRRVYGGRIVTTLVREGVLLAAYGLTVTLAIAFVTVVTLAR
jgi:succinate dehydrogenase hydrophobic anchor subunit